jgi:RNA polymerase primary sigma factor
MPHPRPTPPPGALPPLTRDEEARLLTGYRQHGQAGALDRLVRAHLRFVCAVACQHTGRGLSLQELINAGCLGLIRAIDEYDPSHGTRLLSFAAWWIRKEIRLALATEVTNVRLPASALADRRRVGHHRARLQHLLGEAVGLVDAVAIAVAEGVLAGKPADWAEYAFATESSLDAPADGGDPSGPTRLDRLPAPADEDDGALVCAEMRASLRELVASLEPGLRVVVEMHFGIDRPALGLTQIGAQIGVSRTRARELCHLALDQLRADLLQQRPGPASRLVEMLELNPPSTAEAA